MRSWHLPKISDMESARLLRALSRSSFEVDQAKHILANLMYPAWPDSCVRIDILQAKAYTASLVQQ
jgi:hypothetical protein